MKYHELVKLVEENKFLNTRFSLVSYLIGYKGQVNIEDWDNICKLYADGFIKE